MGHGHQESICSLLLDYHTHQLIRGLCLMAIKANNTRKLVKGVDLDEWVIFQDHKVQNT